VGISSEFRLAAGYGSSQQLNDSCKKNSAKGKTNNNNLELNLCFVLPETSLEEGGGGGGPDRKSH
jgi:hypothetical protein